MSTVRLAMNDQTEEVMTLLEEKFNPMSRSEILRLALARLNQDVLAEEVEILDYEQSKRMEESIRELDSGKGKRFNSVKELMADLEN